MLIARLTETLSSLVQGHTELPHSIFGPFSPKSECTRIASVQLQFANEGFTSVGLAYARLQMTQNEWR